MGAFGVIKAGLNFICGATTGCINLGQRIVCNLQSRKLYSLPEPAVSLSADPAFSAYKRRLRSFGFHPSKREFRIFSPYLAANGSDPSLILPPYVLNNYVVPVLNPIPYRDYFENKNFYDRILPEGLLPRTFCRRMGGRWYDAQYNPVDDPAARIDGIVTPNGRLVVKPTVHSSSGKGVDLFEWDGSGWLSLTGAGRLSPDLIGRVWGSQDLIVQEAVPQSRYLSRFNSSSLNSIRMVVYNSPVDSRPHWIWAGIRVGGKGSVVDNVHAGGLMFGLDREGRLARYGFDQYGKKYREYNGLDFANGDFRIPDFDSLVECGLSLAPLLLPHRLISYDFTLDDENNPRIIEFNIRGYGGWANQFAGCPMLGDFTDEILGYVSTHKKDAGKVFYAIG